MKESIEMSVDMILLKNLKDLEKRSGTLNLKHIFES